MSRLCCTGSLTAFLVIMLMSSAIGRAQTLPDAKLKGLYMNASQNVFQATGAIFSCLSNARKNGEKTGYNLGEAEDRLKAAEEYYYEIAMDRRKTAFRLRTDDGDVRKIFYAYNLEQQSAGKKAVETEGDIAQKNIDAITDLLKQIGTWKTCSPTVKELLNLFQNKIKLERASQIAEIAWGG